LPHYRAPLQEYRFIANEFLRLERHAAIPGFADATGEMLDVFLEGASRICERVAQPLNQPGDIEGCRWEAGEVRTPRGFREAYARFAEGGWIGLAFDPAWGGKGLPGVLAESFAEMLASANLAFSGYIELSEAVFSAIRAHGSDAQKQLYLPKLSSGAWTGAMHLTEAQAGSDLRLVRTRAVAQPDGSYRIHGSKSFITNAEHDLAENIVNLVLARVEGAPAGSGGLSLFIVPKFLPDAAGGLGARNAVACASIEHKMGLRAAPTGVIHYEGAHGWLLGEVNRGLTAMFTMVNDARLGVALQGLSQAEVALQNAVHYARERRQGRALVPVQGGEDPVPIATHPDVRRMLLGMSTFTEAGRGLGLWVALQIDLAARHPDAAERARAERAAALLTPVIKAHFTDWGSEAANLALQCFGGYGYIRDTGVEQFVRDVRITQIYEGTNGIQSLDLVRRKLSMEAGLAAREFFALVADSITAASAGAETAQLAKPMGEALAALEQATGWMQARADGEIVEAASGATDYLRLFGLVALGWVWLDFARICAQLRERPGADRAFHERKLVLARFYMRRILPECALLQARATQGSSDLMALAEEAL
jgi:acyl-CoA dehydrogenase